ncbi:hypothetical protein BO70DRAFT_331061 [Aspergillus heteromorphus CBS 117.55]|uniref:DNA mismatch repair protein S5 domain-containing protein n=1 Tax=Aspergillus heteromorphus CBS 117.55 TaxID=1448321 RepID=A0A317WSW8_9EURO|nr:uncharacterized protein BO70DRAFT_331061 [Aspergillus heteromorphus CBS 117.55]PWY89195.1 hypothetical protein BO70DRAFT_331061 [Aspergillus heteromorphus CBS 117.55]
MPIAALPPTTVRAIGSASALSDPCSVVKELLDNALDASATSVFIEISQNTVDLIQVKDNGHGIPSTDHPSVCKRTFTSKIQTVEDLRSVGGKSLGFRGEALASAAEMSGGLTVGTRVEEEAVGTSVRYGRDGELLSTKHVPHPVGTSVRITDLFKHIPVRRQTVLKNTAKTLVKVKKLVQAYAVAQPSKRLSLRVLKAKTESSNWMYAPQNATLLDAALKIVGAEVAAGCLVREWPGSRAGSTAFRLVALLPDPGSDLSKINALGQYISIDGRPLSATRGIAQDIAKLYKSYIRSTASNLTDPFLCLHVVCTQASYDVNVEPAKDDVLLEEPQELLSMVEDLLCEVYGAQADRTERQAPKVKERVTYKNPFDLLLARKSPGRPTQSSSGGNFTSARFVAQTPAASPDKSAENRIGPRANPWKNFITPTVPNGVTSRDDARVTSPMKRNSDLPCSSRSFFPSPSASSAKTSPASATHSPGMPTSGSPIQTRASRERDRERYGNGSLDTWFAKTTLVSLSADKPGEPVERPLNELAHERFGPQGPVSTHEQKRFSPEEPVGTQSVCHTPTQDAAVDRTAEPEDIEPELQQRHAGQPVLERWSARLHQLSKTAHEGLQTALDFENRKRDAILLWREQQSNPHLSRYQAARAALQPADESKPVLNPHDPRSYLMRQRAQNEDPGTGKVKRINTNKLPLENIPDGWELHDVGLKADPAPATFLTIAKTDLYARCGEQSDAFTADDAGLVDLCRRRLTSLMNADLQFDFSHLARRLEE